MQLFSTRFDLQIDGLFLAGTTGPGIIRRRLITGKELKKYWLDIWQIEVIKRSGKIHINIKLVEDE